MRSPRWRRLAELAGRRRLRGAEIDEFTALYQATAADLSAVRSRAPSPALIGRLSALLGRCRGLATGTHEPGWTPIARFIAVSLPAAFYRLRWWTVAAMVVFVLVGLGYGTWLHLTPGALDAIASPAARADYAEQAFAAYYSNSSAPDFTGQVWSNNAFVALQMIAYGITGVMTAYVLVANAAAVGQAGAIMAEADRLDVFFALILPHGQLELTAIFIACAAGLKLCWAWVRPGPRPRSQALAEEGRALITVAIGLVAVLGVSGVIEGFVPRSGLPSGVKIAIGSLALAGYWAYTIVLGRAAVRAGETGDVLAEEREATTLYAD
nr:stage II sporulation protein M [Pseudactinotalea sp. HY160]